VDNKGLTEVRGRLEEAWGFSEARTIDGGADTRHLRDAIALLGEVDRLKAKNAAMKTSLVDLMKQAETEIHEWIRQRGEISDD